MIQPSIVIEWLKHGHCKCSSCRGSEWKLLHRSKRFKEGCIFLFMALADSCQIYLQSGMLPEKVVDCFVFSRIFAERVDLLSYYSAGVRVSHWCRSSASVAPARENACSAGIMDIVWWIVCPSILVSQGGGQELLSRHRWKELERLDITMKYYEYHWSWLISIDFGLCSLFFWPRCGCYMASSREYDSKSVPELHDNQDESSDCNFKWLQVPCLRKVSWPIQSFRARHFSRNKGWLLPWCLPAIMLPTGVI